MKLQIIQSKIYEIRGQKVMLDFDLAELYETETRILNQAVKRNIDRFPEDFMFQLNESEWESMLSQFVMTSRTKRPKSSLPLAFTEYGVVMMSSVLRSNIAVSVSVLIVRAFITLRRLINTPHSDGNIRITNELKELKEYVEEIFADQNDINEDTRIQLELINETLAKLQPAKHNRPQIGFNSDRYK